MLSGMTTAERVKAARAKAKLSLSETWQASGVHWTAVSAIENGRRQPTLGTLAKLASAFGVSARSLVGEDRPAA